MIWSRFTNIVVKGRKGGFPLSEKAKNSRGHEDGYSVESGGNVSLDIGQEGTLGRWGERQFPWGEEDTAYIFGERGMTSGESQFS